MTDQPLTTGSEIATYIKNFKEQVKVGLGEDAKLAGPIDLEISTTLEKTAGGGFFISVLQAGAKVKHEEVHKVKIPIQLTSEADKVEEEARKIKAERDKAQAEYEKMLAVKNKKDYQTKQALMGHIGF
jgi:hypothetical protein